MYDEHFGLTGRPFQLTPDPAFWYETATHRRAMAYLGYGLAQGEGFIVITGDIGAGKTTLVGHLLDTLDREALNPIKLVSTAIEASDLLRIVATELGVNSAGLEKAQLLTAIERGLHAVARTGRRTLLIVDEAQALAIGALEELRMLSNFQAGGHALLQIVLLGQPEFRSALHGSDRLEQLRQRVIAIHHLEPMGAGEVAAYVRHRLHVVGWSGRPEFADSAFAALHRYSDGVPRRLNQLANRVMLHAAIEGTETITAATVDLVAADLFADLPTMAGPATDLPHAAPAAPAVEEAAPSEPVEAAVTAADEPVAAEQVPELPAPTPPVEAVVQPVVQPVVQARAEPRPFRHSWLAAEAEPAEQPLAVDPPHASVEAVGEEESEPAEASMDAPAPEPEAAPVAEAAPEAEPVDAPATADLADVAAADRPAPPADPAMTERLAELEARMEEQDAALRRVLTLLVDWVENDGAPRPAAASIADPSADRAEEPRGYVPIRGAAA
jgi:putative secretion ATPase (PEP-CTERM system associated)